MSVNYFDGRDNAAYRIESLDKKCALKYQAKLLELLGEINGIVTEADYFLSDAEYRWRWDLSYCCFYREEPVALIVSYYKLADQYTPFDSVYIHRLVTSKEHRRNGVASALLEHSINSHFNNIDWLHNISLQVTMKPINKEAVGLYEKIGFKHFGEKKYSRKIDSVMLLQRGSFDIKKKEVNYEDTKLEYQNPRLGKDGFHDGDIKFYFSTSSEEKRKQFLWLFSLFNLKLDFYNLSEYLIEPQIDSPNTESEQLLVSHPIKNASRFIKKKPFIVEDTMLFVEAFNKDFDHFPELPGLDTKRWWRQFGNEGVLELLRNSTSRRAKYVSQIGCYIDAKNYVYGRAEIEGVIAEEALTSEESEANFPKTNPWFFHQIFIPKGYDRPLSLLSAIEFNICDYRRKALMNLLSNMSDNNLKTNAQLKLEY